MSIIYCIGEALIDFIPLEKGKVLKDVEAFMKAPGGHQPMKLPLWLSLEEALH